MKQENKTRISKERINKKGRTNKEIKVKAEDIEILQELEMPEIKTKFEELDLSNKVKKAVLDNGYEFSTPIQAQAIPHILNGKDIIGQSQTGTGKTAAFSLPLINMLEKSDNKDVEALILSPTRELAIQITDEIRKFIKYEENINCVTVYGGEPIERQIRLLKKGVKIVVGTPGRIMDHIRRKTLKLSSVKMIVLDEADEMLSMGFEEDIHEILSYAPEKRQTLLFSATMNKQILAITKKYLKDPVPVKIKTKQLTVDKIDQIALELKASMKDEIAMRLIDLENPTKAVIFCNTKKKADNLIEILKKKGYKAECLHGDVKQEQRQRIMNRLKNGDFQILVATDVVARGIDVDELELVINYDIPQETEYYVHRIGRTGRKGNVGKAYTFFVGKEKNKIREIEKYANTQITRGNLPTVEEIKKSKNKKLIQNIEQIIKERIKTDDIEKEETKTKKSKMNVENIEILENLTDTNSLKEVALALLEIINPVQSQKISRISNYSSNDMVNLFITVGKKDDIKNKDILGSITANAAVQGSKIGRIKVLDSYSFVEVPGEYVDEVLKGMQGKEIKNRKCNIEVAKK